MSDKPAESAVERWERQYGPGSYGRALNWMACSNVFNSIDAAIAELQDKLDRAQEYARIEVKRKGEAVERECAAIERAEKAEAEELHALRECVHDVVKDALVILNWRGPCSREPDKSWHSRCQWTERARIGTVHLDPESNEYVMPPDFGGDEELRWPADVSQTGNCPVPGNIVASDPDSLMVSGDNAEDTTKCVCGGAQKTDADKSAAKITESVINDGQSHQIFTPEPFSARSENEGSHWHYAAGHWQEDGQDWYDVREVYSCGYTEKPMEPFSETLAGLRKVLRMMADDIDKYPVVEVDDETH